MAIANLALRFVIELGGLAAVGYSGYRLADGGPGGLVLAAGAVMAFIVVWAVVVARNATNALTQPQRDLVGTGLLLIAAMAMLAAGAPVAAVAFGAIVVGNWILLLVFGEEAAAALASAAGRYR